MHFLFYNYKRAGFEHVGEGKHRKPHEQHLLTGDGFAIDSAHGVVCRIDAAPAIGLKPGHEDGHTTLLS